MSAEKCQATVNKVFSSSSFSDNGEKDMELAGRIEI
jgi:hypothetical protein